MDSLLAVTIVLLVFALGDLVSFKTKSIVSMMFVASVIFIVGFWVGLPTTIFEDSSLLGFGALMISFLITHMGTLMSFEDLKKQWKTVIVSIGAVFGIGIFLFLIGSPIIGREYAISAAPPISGGIVAAIIMGEVATAKGLETIAVFATLLVVIQGFFGYPIASFFLNKEAKRLLKNPKIRNIKHNDEVAATIDKGSKKKLIPPLPKDLQTNYILLAKLAITAFIAFKLAGLMNDIIHPYVMCLLVGVFAREIGFLEKGIMTESNAFGLAITALMAVIFSNLTKATPEMLLSLLFPMSVSLILASIAIIIISVVLAKVLKYPLSMAIAVGASALFGFPGTFILSNEVAKANGKTEMEREYLLSEILPKMLIAGFMTVTIASVVLAGFMSKLI